MVKLENEMLEVLIHPKGAELCSLKHKSAGLEYVWSGNPAFWGKHSPVLFPIVGSLKGNTYLYEGKEYQLPRHGFARDRNFLVEESTLTKAVFLLQSDDESKLVYPFDFELRLIYQLKENRLELEYQVRNCTDGRLYFSVGGHPAFALPLEAGTSYEDYKLVFDKPCRWQRWPISAEGLIESSPMEFQPESDQISLSHSLFYGDALVFKNLAAGKLRLMSDKTTHGWEFDFSRFPFLGIWAAKGADFVCIEPWAGIADSVDHNQRLENKEGVLCLEPLQQWSENWGITVY